MNRAPATQRGLCGCLRGCVAVAWIGCCVLLPAAPAGAHLLAPSLLEVRTADASGVVRVLWRTPRLVGGAVPQPRLPCTILQHLPASLDQQALQRSWRLDCGAAGVRGAEFAVSGLAAGGSPTLLRVLLPGEAPREILLSASHPSFRIPLEGAPEGLPVRYFRLGVEHLWGGWDHMAFLAGLVLLFSFTLRLILACSAFTLGHVLTFSLATLGFFHYPILWVELGIALSILLLALELTRPANSLAVGHGHQGERQNSLAVGGQQISGLLRRHPLLLPGAFGLLHGLGFAQALSQLGLREASVPLALLSFNLGIEAGQLLIIAAVLVLLWAGRRAWPSVGRYRWIPIYGLGGLAVYWCLIALENLL